MTRTGHRQVADRRAAARQGATRRPTTRRVGTKPPRIDALARPTHDEAARQRFVSTLRKRIMVDLAQQMRRHYHDSVELQFREKQGRMPQSGTEIRRAMLEDAYFKAWSALRYSAQEQTWWSVQPQVERNAAQISAEAAAVAHRRGPGSLRLDPKLAMPRDVTAMDIHLMPGCFHTEYSPGDVSTAAMYWHGTAVFSAGLKMRHNGGGVARSIAHFLKCSRPDFSPKHLLDIGCSAGNQLLPYLDVYPELIGHGIDVSAPLLRYAHARARSLGYPVHYSQQDARSLDYPDASFDLVVSSFFLHEQSPTTNRKVLREAYRVLRPGGIMVHMELPPTNAVDPYYNFYLDWDAYYNNEPHYASFRKFDLATECAKAGFASDSFFARRIPNWGTVGESEFAESARGERPAPAHGNGASWYLFGAVR
jgi:SAM-dependent methyltransferase